MTPEQIKNFRSVLVGMIGPYALIMPDEEIVAMRDKFQERLDDGLDTIEIDPADCTECGDDGEEPNPYCPACGNPDAGVDAYKEGGGAG